MIHVEDGPGQTCQTGELSGRRNRRHVFAIASSRDYCERHERIEAALTPDLLARVGFTLGLFDTKRDTPAALAAYRLTHALPGKTGPVAQ